VGPGWRPPRLDPALAASGRAEELLEAGLYLPCISPYLLGRVLADASRRPLLNMAPRFGSVKALRRSGSAAICWSSAGVTHSGAPPPPTFAALELAASLGLGLGLGLGLD
jgi:hypothetical protein